MSVQKKNDLIKLCNDGVIPKDHHGFYESLKTSKKCALEYENEGKKIEIFLICDFLINFSLKCDFSNILFFF